MFITFEGPDGSGKTTQIGLLATWLREQGRDVVCTREPGGIPASEAIRELVLHRDFTAEGEALLFLAARAEHVRTLIRPALESGSVVVCDRFNDSTLAYQGYGLGLNLAVLRELCAFATGGLEPDLTVLLDLPPESGLKRRRGGSGTQLALELDLSQEVGVSEEINRLDNRALEFHRRVRDGFLAEANLAPHRVRRLSARRTIDQVHEEIRELVNRRLTGRGRQPRSSSPSSGKGDQK